MANILGGVSTDGCLLDLEKQTLIINGWFYPSGMYDTLEIYYNNNFLGCAKCGIERGDVHKIFNDEDALNTGFFGCFNNIDYKEYDKTIFIVIKKDDQIVDYRFCEIQLLSYKNKIDRCVQKNGLSFRMPVESGSREVKWIRNVQEVDFDAENIYYVICSEKWFNTVEELERSGLKVFEDFIPVWYGYFVNNGLFRLDLIVSEVCNEQDVTEYLLFLKKTKKLCFLHGNCQIYKIGEIVAGEKQFAQKYVVVRTPSIMRLGDRWKHILRGVINQADLFIYQNISLENKWGILYSSKYILTALSKETPQICIPNMYFTGYWPQYEKSNKNYLVNSSDLMPYGDKNIKAMFDENADCDLEMILDENYYSEKTFEENVSSSIKQLRDREVMCDIKISDYIENRYKSVQLFHTINHPTLELYYEFVNRLLKKLGILNACFKGEVLPQNGTEIPIYPSIEKYLEFRQEKMNFNSLIGEDLSGLTKQQWFEKYIHYFYS